MRIDRAQMTPEERELFDASYVGAVDRLDREAQALKLVLFGALPYWLQRIIARFYGRP